MTLNRSKDWLDQAVADLNVAQQMLYIEGAFSHVCFMCQQASEKALKSILLYKGAKQIFSHSLFALCKELHINGDLEDAAKTLDQYYISARYPDALLEGNPSVWFTKKQAFEAVDFANKFIKKAQESWTIKS